MACANSFARKSVTRPIVAVRPWLLLVITVLLFVKPALPSLAGIVGTVSRQGCYGSGQSARLMCPRARLPRVIARSAEPSEVAAAPPVQEGHDGGVPGLGAWLRELGLEARLAAAAGWCEAQGACDLEEVVESLEEFASALSLGPLDESAARKAAALVKSHPLGSVPPAMLPDAPKAAPISAKPRNELAGVAASATVLFAKLHSASKAGKIDEARRWFAAYEKADATPRLTLITAAGLARDPESAERWFRALAAKDGSVTIGSVNALVDAYALADEVDRAEARFCELLSTELEPNTESFVVLLRAVAATGDVQKIDRCFERMVKKGVRPSLIHYSHLLQCYASAVTCPVQKVQQTLASMDDLLLEMRGKEIKLNKATIKILIDAYTLAGETDRAEDLKQLA